MINYHVLTLTKTTATKHQITVKTLQYLNKQPYERIAFINIIKIISLDK